MKAEKTNAIARHLFVFISTLLLSSVALAQAAPDRTAAIRQIQQRVDETYVVPELRPVIIAQLERARLAHRYDVADPDLFVTRVNEDLQAAAHDGHLYLANDQAQYAALLAPPESKEGIEAYRHALAVRNHSGLTKLEILTGNVRYLRLERFQWIPGITAKAYDDAADFLQDGDAIIIDLRSNGGGNSEAADYFSRVFLAPDPRRPGDPASRGRNAAWANKRLYLLVDGGGASAAEAVAYGAQQEKTAWIVGSTTYGAANNNKRFAIAPQFVLSVSYNRPINPISGTNWEGVGVKPDISVAAERALDAALGAALDHLGSAKDVMPERLAEYRWARTAIEARLHPPKIDPARMSGWAGTFGTIEIKRSEAGLLFYRSDRPKRPQGVLMVPLDDQGLFGVPGYSDLRAKIGPTEVVLLHGAEDAREVFARNVTR